MNSEKIISKIEKDMDKELNSKPQNVFTVQYTSPPELRDGWRRDNGSRGNQISYKAHSPDAILPHVLKESAETLDISLDTFSSEQSDRGIGTKEEEEGKCCIHIKQKISNGL